MSRVPGTGLIDLSSGQITEPLPDGAVRALREAMAAERVTAYAPSYGNADLREAVAGHYTRRTGAAVDPERVTVTAGARHGLFAAFATVAAGGEILVPQPHWSHYPGVIRSAGATPVPVAGDPERGMLVDPRRLDRALTPRTRALLINSPVNPSGACYTPSRMRALREWAAERDVRLVVDDVYWAYADSVDDQVGSSAGEIVVGGASKVHAMAGLRIGWVWADPEYLAPLRAVVEYTTGPVSGLSQSAVAAVLGDARAVEARAARLAQMRGHAVRAMSGIPLLTPVPAAGGIYLCLDATEALPHGIYGATDDVGLCRALERRAGVRLRAGSTFGMPGFLRLCVAEPPRVITDAAGRLAGRLHVAVNGLSSLRSTS
ncbi:pyridoxal phosphate-dependent aminotransferase [Streptomyces sp. NPDC005533]|uniref:pyridoxal phosphate-dependent aminotransferase n=1 Tax=Streptomyces sp. NPDC005533 TaxID=3364723 RepID=UPI0036BB7C74